MKTRVYQTILILFATGQFLIPAKQAFAVTATPSAVNYTQPDGSHLTIILKGDEFIHWAVTEDGYTVMTNSSGVYEYAAMDKAGRLVFSGIQAGDPASRTQAINSWLAKTGKGLFFNDAQVEEMRLRIAGGGSSDAPLTGGFPTTGTRKLLMILANFSNTTSTYPQGSFNNYMNQLNYNGTGSFRDYYLEVSYGQLTVNTTVTVWVNLPNTHDYYGPDTKWGEFAYEAIVAANNQAGVNFAEYDNNLDGTVDGVAVIHQGQGQEETGNFNDIWSHSWDLSSAGYSYSQRTFDGVQVNSYTTMPERNATGMGTIGVMCHEFGHNLGSPDFYDTDYSTNGSYTGTGKWDLMAGGSWNGVSGSKPAHPNPWIKAFFNWTSPQILGTIQNVTLRNAQAFPDVVRYNTQTANEYFLCENRQQTGFDAGLPGHGLLIYHVDGNYITAQMSSNKINASAHQGMYPVCANATGNPTGTYGTINAAGCTFPGSANKTSFSDATIPNARAWSNANTNFPLTSIFEYGPTQEITFCFISCFTAEDPSGFAASASGISLINMSWALNSNSNPVLIAYNTTPAFGIPAAGTNYTAGGSLTGGGTIIYNGSLPSFAHTGLNASTTYYYKAWSIMPGASYSPGVTSYATTFCGTVASFPWAEGFENAGAMPGCWTQEQVSNSGLSWSFIAGNGSGNPSSAHTGSYNASLKDKTVADNKTRLVSPALNLSLAVNPQLSFWHTQPQWGSDQDKLSVYYKTSAGGTWTLLIAYNASVASWTQETLSLPNSSQSYYIAFEGNAKFGYGICIDDILVASACTSYVPVSISIAASMNPVCAGTMVTDTAIVSYGGTAPVYQWQAGGTNITGATNPTYTHTPAGTEEISCVVISNASCIVGNPAYSNVLSMIANQPLIVGSINGNQTITTGTVPQGLAGVPPQNGIAPAYQWQSSIDNLTFNNIDGATLLNYQPAALSATTYFRQFQQSAGTCGGPSSTNIVMVTVSSHPSNNLLQNSEVTSTQCFDAIQTITVAGNGSVFTIQNGASVTMIAGQQIRYLPGTVVKPGAYLHGYITTTGEFCPAQPPAMVNAGVEDVPAIPSLQRPMFKTYPNPTPGNFTLELTTSATAGQVMVEIYSMTGKKMLSTGMTGNRQELSLSSMPTGIYLIKVIDGENAGTTRMIKQ